MRIPARLLMVLGLLAVAPLPAEQVAINAQVFNGYARKQLPDGTFEPEFYTFAEGGCWSRAVKDPWMEKLKFLDVARAVAGPLAKANFRPGLKTAEIKLLIIVYWGSTQGSAQFNPNDSIERAGTAIANQSLTEDAGEKNAGLMKKPVDSKTPEGAAYETMLWQLGVSNRWRDDLDERNARILGYSEALDRARFALTTALSRDINEELASSRYYVVLQAYDFETASKKKKLRPLWTTRLSVREGGTFGDALNRMVWSGNRYFGRNTDGLKREREAKVELPPVKFLDEEVVPAQK